MMTPRSFIEPHRPLYKHAYSKMSTTISGAGTSDSSISLIIFMWKLVNPPVYHVRWTDEIPSEGSKVVRSHADSSTYFERGNR